MQSARLKSRCYVESQYKIYFIIGLVLFHQFTKQFKSRIIENIAESLERKNTLISCILHSEVMLPLKLTSALFVIKTGIRTKQTEIYSLSASDSCFYLIN